MLLLVWIQAVLVLPIKQDVERSPYHGTLFCGLGGLVDS